MVICGQGFFAAALSMELLHQDFSHDLKDVKILLVGGES